MRVRIGVVVAVGLLPLLTGCIDLFSDDDVSAGPSPAPSAPSPSAPPLHVLDLGKSMVELEAGTLYRSPRGFAPQLTITVSADGWVSTHRGLDAFDVSQPAPGADTALAVYAFVVPPERSAEQAIAALRQRADAAGATLEQTGDYYTLQVTGGDGPLVTSRDGGIALDAVPTGYVRITADDHAPFLTVWWVPDAAHGDEAEALASTLSIDTDTS